jgi:hypothetical protein
MSDTYLPNHDYEDGRQAPKVPCGKTMGQNESCDGSMWGDKPFLCEQCWHILKIENRLLSALRHIDALDDEKFTEDIREVEKMLSGFPYSLRGEDE